MPPPENSIAERMASIMFKEHKRRYDLRLTLDSYPASHSDLIWCAIALIEDNCAPSGLLENEHLRKQVRDLTHDMEQLKTTAVQLEEEKRKNRELQLLLETKKVMTTAIAGSTFDYEDPLMNQLNAVTRNNR